MATYNKYMLEPPCSTVIIPASKAQKFKLLGEVGERVNRSLKMADTQILIEFSYVGNKANQRYIFIDSTTLGKSEMDDPMPFSRLVNKLPESDIIGCEALETLIKGPLLTIVSAMREQTGEKFQAVIIGRGILFVSRRTDTRPDVWIQPIFNGAKTIEEERCCVTVNKHSDDAWSSVRSFVDRKTLAGQDSNSPAVNLEKSQAGDGDDRATPDTTSPTTHNAENDRHPIQEKLPSPSTTDVDDDIYIDSDGSFGFDEISSSDPSTQSANATRHQSPQTLNDNNNHGDNNSHANDIEQSDSNTSKNSYDPGPIELDPPDDSWIYTQPDPQANAITSVSSPAPPPQDGRPVPEYNPDDHITTEDDLFNENDF